MPSVIEVKVVPPAAAVGTLQHCSSSGWAQGLRKWWGPLFGFCFWDYGLGSLEISVGI